MLSTGLASSGKQLQRAMHKWGAAVLVAASLATGALLGGVAQARSPERPVGTSEAVALVALPNEAQTTHQLVTRGGPFPYAKDGTVFGNRERLLPSKPRGHYREYTVKTPGAKNRGARRIVCGGTPPSQPEACYYTDDHYASFRRIAP